MAKEYPREKYRKKWRDKVLKEGRCWRCGDPAERIFNSKGQPVGFRKLCTAHMEKDRQRCLAKYHSKKEKLAA